MELYQEILVILLLTYLHMCRSVVHHSVKIVVAVMADQYLTVIHLVRKKSVLSMEIIVVFMMIQAWITQNVMSALQRAGTG